MNTKQCKTCNKYFAPKNSTQSYCGADCARRRGTNYPFTRECLRKDCGVNFEVVSGNKRKTYCSHKCAAIAINGLGVTRIPNELRSTCTRCGNPIEVGCTSRVYCSECSKTRKEWKTQEKVNKWKSGDTSEIESNKYKSLTNWAKNYLLSLHNYTCTECGWNTPNPTLGRPILTVDHVDGNWKNNQYDNLKVICYNCHTLTPTFGNLNRGSSSGMRPYAAERSRNGYTGVPRVKPKRSPTVCSCGAKIHVRAKKCRDCHLIEVRSDIPDLATLSAALLSYNLVFTQVGRHFGVSDNAVRKWCRNFGLPLNKKTLREMLTRG